MSTRKIFRCWALVLVVLTLSMLLAGCQNAAEDEEAPVPTPAGSVVYASNCASCHGENGAGGSIGPAIRPTDMDEEELFTIIADGVSGTKMPAYRGRIGEGEVRQVIAYLLEK